jgi:hypothetical protein
MPDVILAIRAELKFTRVSAVVLAGNDQAGGPPLYIPIQPGRHPDRTQYCSVFAL